MYMYEDVMLGLSLGKQNHISQTEEKPHYWSVLGKQPNLIVWIINHPLAESITHIAPSPVRV